MTNVLTPRRRAILRAMWKNGRLTIRELADKVGLKSTGQMQGIYLWQLRDAGYVTWEPERQRTLRLTGKGLLAAQGYELIYTCDADGIHKEAK